MSKFQLKVIMIVLVIPLRKLAHAIYRAFFKVVKIKFFKRKVLIYFLVLLQNIDCGPWGGGSNEYPQSMFWRKKRKIGIPLHNAVLLHKSGVYGGIYFRAEYRPLSLYGKCISQCVLNISYKQESQFSISYRSQNLLH